MPRLPAALLVLAALSGACSSGDDEGTTTTAPAETTSTTSTLPPTASGQKISNTDTSKFSEVDTTTRDSPRGPKSAPAHAARLATPAWVTTTPLGRPVDPDV